MNQALLLLLSVLAVVLFGVIVIYNRLVHDRNQSENAFSDVEVQLKRRSDLVPQLVAAVKAYADFEQATLLAVTELRAEGERAVARPLRAKVEDAMTEALHRFVVVAENYPELKANENFRQLQESLVETEDYLQKARRFYNGAVRLYNTRCQSFPDLLVAGMFGFRPAEYFEAGSDAQQSPKVRLSP